MRFVPKSKMSKRDRSAINKQRRNTWAMNPTNRVKQSGKIYDRRKIKYDTGGNDS